MTEENLYIKAKEIVLPGGQLGAEMFVHVRNGIIADISKVPFANVDDYLQAELLSPGFCDIHTHGLGGSDDVLSFWTHPEYTQSRLPRYGTTSFLASTVCPCAEELLNIRLDTVANLKKAFRRLDLGAVLEGIHSEGPVVSDLGALPSTNTHLSSAEFDALVKSMLPELKVMTIAPTLLEKTNFEFIKILLDNNVLPSLGHDRTATTEAVLGCLRELENFKAIRHTFPKLHITHLFNVCNFNHRLPSLANFGLIDSFPLTNEYYQLTPPTVEVICDFAHVHPMTISTLFKCRSFRDIVCVTDNMMEPIAGKQTFYCGRQVEVSPDAKAVFLKGTTTLAGSCCSLLDAVVNLVTVIGVPIAEAIACVSENPCRIIGLDHIGSIAVGKRADLLFLTTEDLKLRTTMIAGKVVYQAE